MQFELHFNHSILQLLHNFPAAQTTAAGARFWSGTKRMPAALLFDPLNALHVDFVSAAAHLQATVYGLHGAVDRATVRQLAAAAHVSPFRPREGVKVSSARQGTRGNSVSYYSLSGPLWRRNVTRLVARA